MTPIRQNTRQCFSPSFRWSAAEMAERRWRMRDKRTDMQAICVLVSNVAHRTRTLYFT